MTEDIEDVKLWGEYVQWLSGGKTSIKKDFVTRATGSSFYESSAANKLNFEIGPDGKKSYWKT